MQSFYNTQTAGLQFQPRATRNVMACCVLGSSLQTNVPLSYELNHKKVLLVSISTNSENLHFTDIYFSE